MKSRLHVFTQQFPSRAEPTAGLYNSQQYENLSELYDVDLVVPVPWIKWMRFRSMYREQVSELRPTYVPYFYTPFVFRQFYWWFMQRALGRYRKYILDRKPQAVIVSWAYPDGVAVERLLRGTGQRLFFEVHGSDVYLHCSFPDRRRRVIDSMKRADGVLSVSQALKTALVDYGVPASKIHVVYNGVDKQKFKPVDRIGARQEIGVDADRTVFLFVGNLKVEKGPVDLLEAFIRLANGKPDKKVTLILIGARGDRGYVGSCIENAQHENPHLQILAPGPKMHDQLNVWINAANFLCLPSYSEGVPNVVLEALGCGVPTIASSVGGIPEVIDEATGILVPPGDVDALQLAMNDAMEMTWDRELILERGKRFDWKKNVQEIARILERDIDTENKVG